MFEENDRKQTEPMFCHRVGDELDRRHVLRLLFDDVASLHDARDCHVHTSLRQHADQLEEAAEFCDQK